MTVLPSGAVWVRLPRFIGDAVMMGRELEPLRAAGIPLVAWGPEPVADLFAGSNWFDAALGDGPGKPGAIEMARTLQAHHPAALVNLPRSARGLIAGLLARVPLRLGWREGGGRWLATLHLPFSGPGHQAERYRELLARCFPGHASPDPRPFRPREEALDEARRLRKERAIEAPFVIVGLGAAAWIKRLGTAVWESLIPKVEGAGLRPVLLGGTFREDREQAAALLRTFPGIADLCGKSSLPVSAALVAEASLVVANDSALAHLAAACGTPSVTAFGPTDPARTAPLGPCARIVRREDLDCLACLSFTCRRGNHACMQALEAEEIWRVCSGLLLEGQLQTRR